MNSSEIAHQFLYVPALERNPNQPRIAWVSDCPDSIEPRSEQNPHLLTFDETDPDEEYLVVAHKHGYFLDIDIDVEEGHDAHVDFDIEQLDAPHGALFFSSPSGGRHIVLTLSEEFQGLNGKHGIDLQSDIRGTLGMFTSPFHNNEYTVIQDGDTEVWWDGTLEGLEMEEYTQEEVFGVKLLQFSDDFDTDFDIEVDEESPDNMPSCLHELLHLRRDINREETNINTFVVDSAIGMRLVAFGYDYDESIDILQEYPPQDGFNEQTTRYQLRKLYQKELHPHSRSTLNNEGIELSSCSCRFCNNSDEFIAEDPVHADDWTVEANETVPHIIMPSIARTGKSYTMIGEAAKLLEKEQFNDKRIAYICSAHSEGDAARQKFIEHGIDDVAYLMGQDRAKKEYSVNCTGEYPGSYSARTPEAAEKLNCENQYQALQKGNKAARVTVTVPEKLDAIGDRDWLIMTEEAAFDRMLSTSITVVDVERHMSDDRQFMQRLSGYYQDRLQDVVNYIDDLDRISQKHQWIQATCQKLLAVSRRIENWSPGDWSCVEDSWESVVEDVDNIMSELAFLEEPDLDATKTWLDNNFRDVTSVVLNAMFYDGVHAYSNGENKQLFIIGDCDRLFVTLPDGFDTLWTAGNSVAHMEHFHDILHNDETEVKPFYGGVTPVQDSVRVIRYTGGDNPNQQANHVQQAVTEFRNAFNKRRNMPGGLIISGSSKYCASHATRIRGCEQPSETDSLEDVRYALEVGQLLAIPENSRYSEGVDTPEAAFSAIYNGNFATPREDYMEEQYNQTKLKRSEKIRAAQNAILRASDVLNENTERSGTGVTPVLVPDRHVPEEIWELFDEYGIEVWEQEQIAQVKRLLIGFVELEEDLEVHDGRIQHSDHTPDDARQFMELVRDQVDSTAG